jgi:hypothetical protein
MSPCTQSLPHTLDLPAVFFWISFLIVAGDPVVQMGQRKGQEKKNFCNLQKQHECTTQGRLQEGWSGGLCVQLPTYAMRSPVCIPPCGLDKNVVVKSDGDVFCTMPF